MRAAPIFLGLADADAGTALPHFAADLSAWQPAGVDAAATAAFFDPSEQAHPALPSDHRFAELRGVMARLSPTDAELAATGRGLLQWHETHGFCARCGAESRHEAGGWQRRCPACGAHHFPRTDPVVIVLVTRGNRLLVGRSHGWPEGMYSLLAGFVEPGETIEAAVRREVGEETGVRIGAVRYLASQPWPFPASLMLGCAAEAESEAITLDPVELEAALWVSREEMVEVLGGRHPVIRPARRGAIAHHLITAWVADRLP
jgi:NAD+ diphosphatase